MFDGDMMPPSGENTDCGRDDENTDCGRNSDIIDLQFVMFESPLAVWPSTDSTDCGSDSIDCGSL